MDRETRKANLNKLRLSGIKHIGTNSIGGSLRKTSSANGLLSKYFKTAVTNELNPGNVPKIEVDVKINSPCSSCSISSNLVNTDDYNLQTISQQNETQIKANVGTRGRKRTSLQKFIFPKDNSEDNVEVPIKKIKTKTNLKRKNNVSRCKSSLNRRQPNIKSLLMRNEVMFSEITSVQCRIDNFSADDIHLAMALSKSQIEIGSSPNRYGAAQRIENSEVNMENVQNILRKYGFRTAGIEDYNSLKTTTRRGRNKWANKFTALTLRDSKLQAKKVQYKINCLMSQELNENQVPLSKTHSESYSIFSYNLNKLKPSKAIIKILESENSINLEEFYVKELFDVSHVQAGYLLKNWHAIDGRELSPQGTNKSQNPKSNEIQKLMNQSLINLEQHFSIKQNLNSRFQPEKETLSFYATVSDHLGSEKIKIYNAEQSYHIKDDPKYYNNKVNVVKNDIECIENNEVLSGHDTLVSINKISIEQDGQTYNSADTDIKHNVYSSSPSLSEYCSTTPKGGRIQSPNIFASSEDELDGVDIPKVASNNEYEQLNSFKEVISTSNNINNTENFIAQRCFSNIIDLTKELQMHDLSMVEHVSSGGECFRLNNVEKHNKLCEDFLIDEESDFDKSITKSEYCGCKSLPILTDINFLSNSSTNSENIEGVAEENLIGNMKPNDFSENSTCRTMKENSFNRNRDTNTSVESLEFVLSNENPNTIKEDSGEDCIFLSDDEINYSIWKSDLNSFSPEFPSNLQDDTFGHKQFDNNILECSILNVVTSGNFRRTNSDLTTATISPSTIRKDLEIEPCEILSTSRLTDRSAELLEYGIIDNISEPFTQPSDIIYSPTHYSQLNVSFSPMQLAPVGLDGLLNGEINLNRTKQNENDIDIQSYTRSIKPSEYPPDEYEISGRLYSTRIITDPKPEFTLQSESEILKQLYEYGIKPLKRKQAVKLLEYIYNSTNPLILKDIPNCSKQPKEKHLLLEHSDKNPPRPSNHIILHSDKLSLKDCFDTKIHLFKHELQLDLECEDYVFQTNITKKIFQISYGALKVRNFLGFLYCSSVELSKGWNMCCKQIQNYGRKH
ncbi:structure-specific endonuclease subunit SLX4 isoform X2 [Zeugodacus cucurbitae]|uniref:structure-specific endonuclease subunit SLX4 isoform X2 n=1 Tax=Zeugodacus cucurbitae TaxID=28588 RepID=UPI0023D968C8|nr:structure-specific endonuclease subunit SLX4 isoform X2 [Zeugodacus cucurbitae]